MSRLLTSYAAPPGGSGNGGGGGSSGHTGGTGGGGSGASATTITLSQAGASSGSSNSASVSAGGKANTPPPDHKGSGNGGNGKSSGGSGGGKRDDDKRGGGGGSKSSTSSSSSSSKTSNGDGKQSGGSSGAGGSTVATIARDPSPYKTKTNRMGEEMVIIDVWAGNLKQELDRIMDIVDEYNFIAMDTEFPGIVARPLGCFKNAHDYHYQTLKCNVDLLKIIQLGLTFCNGEGKFLPGTCSWQFNFKFNLSEDMYAQDSIDMLTKSGIDFKEHDARGIDVEEFGELVMTSGIVLNEDVRWLSFHSGYDYGYLLKLLTCQMLPKEEPDFFDLLRTYFPVVYDVKYLMKSCENLKGGLQKVAEDLQVERIGPQHQAGSDSLLTAATFFKIRSLFFENNIEDAKFAGVLYGLGQQLKSKTKQENDDQNA